MNAARLPPPKLSPWPKNLLVRLETEGVAVRLNLLGQPGEQPDFVVASWVLPYVYALRGDRDWRRSPQLTGSRAVSQLAIQAYKLLEAGDATIPQLKHALGREVTESAVLRAITELWQQLRIIPVISAPGRTPQWQLLRVRFQKAIAEGASTSQVTAISVLASIYLQAVIAASMEEVELFLAPLTARSKVREVLRGLVATRQVHTISMGHAPQFYVAGTLPEFTAPSSIYGGSYSSSSMPASAQFLRSYEREFDDARAVCAGFACRAGCEPLLQSQRASRRRSHPGSQPRPRRRSLQPCGRTSAASRLTPGIASLRQPPRRAAWLAVRRGATARAPMAVPAMQPRCAGRTAQRKTEMATATASRMAPVQTAPTACTSPSRPRHGA